MHAPHSFASSAAFSHPSQLALARPIPFPFTAAGLLLLSGGSCGAFAERIGGAGGG